MAFEARFELVINRLRDPMPVNRTPRGKSRPKLGAQHPTFGSSEAAKRIVLWIMKTKSRTVSLIFGPLVIGLFAMQAVGQCGEPFPYTPPPRDVGITSGIDGESVSVSVEVSLPDTCFSLGNWGRPRRFANSYIVDAQFYETSSYCLCIVLSVSTNYSLGPLPPGNYSFHFRAWGTCVRTQEFSVPLSAAIRAPQGDSKVHLCWSTAQSACYRLEHCSTLDKNEWEPLTGWIPGNGKQFCTNDAVMAGQPQKFYRVAVTNTLPIQIPDKESPD